MPMARSSIGSIAIWPASPPDRARPGYRHVIFAPHPPAGIEWARATVNGPLGPTSIEWHIETNGDLSVDIVLPFGASGSFIAPVSERSEVSCDGTSSGHEVSLDPGRHQLLVTSPRISAG